MIAARKQAILYLLLLLLPAASPAGTTGSIAGMLSSADGTPQPGATVYVPGTPYGAITDANGEYFIYNLPPGLYDLCARMVGMTTVTKEGVRVITDQMTRVDFELGVDPSGHTVIEVRDQRSLILESVPATIHFLDLDEIRLMPVRSILDVIARQPGIVSQGGAMHVRGGRPGEVAFLIDGIPVRSPMTNTFSSVLPLAAITETSVMTGGISAEYGNAMSGVVNMVSRDGGDDYEGEVSSRYGDLTEFGAENVSRNYSEPSENDNYRSGAIDADCALGGPEPITSCLLPLLGIDLPGEVTFFGSARVLVSGRDLEDSRGYWENNWQNGFNGSLKLTARPSSGTTVSLLGYYDYRQSGWDEWAWSDYDKAVYIDGDLYVGQDPDYAIPIRFWETGGATATITRMLGETTFLDLKLNQNRFCQWRRIRDEDGGYYGDGYSPTDWITVVYPSPRVADSLGFYHSGIHPEVWLESRSLVSTGKLDLTSRLSSLVELKTGLEAIYYDIYDYSVHMEDQGLAYASLWEAYPFSGAAYTQATLRFGAGMVLNAGLRFDLFDPNCEMFELDQGTDVDVPAKHQLSPRFGMSHPVTDRDVFFATYGHYFQMPNLNELFYGTDYGLPGMYSIVGNPDLEAQRTIAYEVGVRHRFDDVSSIALSAFYKDITGLVRTVEHYSETYDYYHLYENDDSHGSVRGLECKLLRLPGGWLSGNLAYSFSIAKGRYSTSIQAYGYAEGGATIEPTEDNYLDWDQRHTASAHITLSAPEGMGPRILGHGILGGSSMNIDWCYGSGFPFSPPAGTSEQPQINTESYPWTMQTDLGLSKKIPAGGAEIEIGATIHNVFNRRNLNKIFDPGYYLETGAPGGEIGNPGAWSPARHMFFRLSVYW
ncbi:TonB-dependent receptor [Candidatus Fermentibacterales bacterium]|nr:TonB-dependent receptor [Candidatus Fermentibacterales bacterium]